MPSAIVMKLVKPSRFIKSVFFDAFEQAASAVADEMYADFLSTTKTWNNKPAFEKIVQVGDDSVQALVGTDNDIYRFVNDGTKVRYATMSKDFRAKTQVGVIGSGPGQGRRLFINKRYPRPGIQARKFDETIQKKWVKRFKDRMQKALKVGVNNSGHRIQVANSGC